ncbi:MAG: metallophosphoesterase [Candidatus Neomarinimicrobiota bacterium]
MFFLVAITILWIIHGYVSWRIIPTLGLTSLQVNLGYLLMFLLSLLPLFPILLRLYGSEAKIIDRFSLLGYTSLGFFVLSFIALIMKDVFIQIISIFESLFISDTFIDDSKRSFLKKSLSIGVIGITGSASAYGFYSSRKGPMIIYQDIYLESLPIEFENFTIAQISDLHVGPTIKRKYVEGVYEKIGQVNPDLIAVTGDLVDGSVKHLSADLQPFKDLIARYGTYFVTGNHEYYSGVDSWLDETDRLGMINLINQNRLISKDDKQIAIAGITDYRAHQIKREHRSDPKKALNFLDEDILKIMLAHQPNSIHLVHAAGADLQLSGHTHGGQFWPLNYPTKLANAYLAGHYDHKGTQIYVNSGTGYWGPPLRIGIPAEITLLRLKKKVVL